MTQLFSVFRGFYSKRSYCVYAGSPAGYWKPGKSLSCKGGGTLNALEVNDYGQFSF